MGGGANFTKWASIGEIREEQQCNSNCIWFSVDSYNLDFIIQNTNGKYVIATNNGTSEQLEKKGFKMDLIVLEFSAERLGWQNKENQYDVVNLPSPWADGYCLVTPLGSGSSALTFYFIFFLFFLLEIIQNATDNMFNSCLTADHMISIVVWKTSR